MDKPPSTVQSFIVKLWLDEFGDEMGRDVWRGHITHVPDGQRRYLKRLSDIDDFIRDYRIELRFERGPRSRLLDWLKRWTKDF